MEVSPNPYAAPAIESERVPLSGLELGKKLRLTGIGCRAVCLGIFIMAGAWIAGFLSAVTGPDVAFPVVIFAGLGLFGLLVLSAGPILCTTAPAGYGLRGFAMATVLVQMLAVIGFGATFALPGMFVVIAVGVLGLISASLFLIFLNRLAECLRRPDLVQRSRRVGVLMAVVAFGLFPVAAIGSTSLAPLGMFIGLGYFVAVLVLLLAYAMLASTIANGIAAVLPSVAQINDGIE